MKRALLFGGGLLLLWVALQLLPSKSYPDQPAVYSDDAGTVATRSEEAPDDAAPAFLSPGMIAAVLILAGGTAFAYYLRKRTSEKDAPAPITALGEFTVGPSQSLRLVECGQEVLLLGVTGAQINLIRSYPLDHFQDELSALRRDASNGGRHFADVLHQYAGRNGHIESTGS